VASTSRARATFQSELIERSTTDDLPNNIKGTAVYKSFADQEGYYVFDKNLQGYIPIHFLEDRWLWTLINYDDKAGSWYTTEPAPLEYGLGPYRSKPAHGIDVDSSEGELADTKDSKDTHQQTTTPTPLFSQYAMSTTTQAQTTTTAPTTTSGSSLTIQSIPLGGGGGGGSGGGGGGGGGGVPPAGPPTLTGKLGGNPPKEFLGDREESKSFLLNFLLYRGMNPHVEQLTIPYQRSMTFLSYIRGPLVNNWVEEQAQWLIDQVTGGVAHAEENLWATIETRFCQAYTDMAEKQKAQHNIRDLKMKGDDLDSFIAQFTTTAKKAGYDLNSEATLDIFQRALPFKLVANCVKFDHTVTWNDWMRSAQMHQQEYIFLKERVKGNDWRGGATKFQWRNALNNKNPNAMDIGHTRARTTFTDEEKRQRIQSGLCFCCNQKGHIARYYPQQGSHAAEASMSTTPVITIQMQGPVSAAQKAQALITTLHTETEEVRDCFAKELFGKKDFLNT